MPRLDISYRLIYPALHLAISVTACGERHYDPCADETHTWAWISANYDTTCGITIVRGASWAWSYRCLLRGLPPNVSSSAAATSGTTVR